ncbi:Transmembrane protein 120B [Galemys pyrenaicus]|uniref:Transmembrane protein 120B n=1 Tax=Galemys pyrenaicus TaxID=202257 RepID=A0A8J6A491_GALPY|nr:Transmembrane protein 120B [Galemys pyrenaicus]
MSQPAPGRCLGIHHPCSVRSRQACPELRGAAVLLRGGCGLSTELVREEGARFCSNYLDNRCKDNHRMDSKDYLGGMWGGPRQLGSLRSPSQPTSACSPALTCGAEPGFRVARGSAGVPGAGHYGNAGAGASRSARPFLLACVLQLGCRSPAAECPPLHRLAARGWWASWRHPSCKGRPRDALTLNSGSRAAGNKPVASAQPAGRGARDTRPEPSRRSRGAARAGPETPAAAAGRGRVRRRGPARGRGGARGGRAVTSARVAGCAGTAGARGGAAGVGAAGGRVAEPPPPAMAGALERCAREWHELDGEFQELQVGPGRGRSSAPRPARGPPGRRGSAGAGPPRLRRWGAHPPRHPLEPRARCPRAPPAPQKVGLEAPRKFRRVHVPRGAAAARDLRAHPAGSPQRTSLRRWQLGVGRPDFSPPLVKVRVGIERGVWGVRLSRKEVTGRWLLPEADPAELGLAARCLCPPHMLLPPLAAPVSDITGRCWCVTQNLSRCGTGRGAGVRPAVGEGAAQLLGLLLRFFRKLEVTEAKNQTAGDGFSGGRGRGEPIRTAVGRLAARESLRRFERAVPPPFPGELRATPDAATHALHPCPALPQETHRVYRQKLEELTALQTLCSSSVQRQKSRLKDLRRTLQGCRRHASREEAELIQRMGAGIKERQNVFFDMEAYLPKKNGFAYKDEYEKFKLYLTIILLLGAVACRFVLHYRVTDEVFNFLLVWYYCTLTIRESILISNGSRYPGRVVERQGRAKPVARGRPARVSPSVPFPGRGLGRKSPSRGVAMACRAALSGLWTTDGLRTTGIPAPNGLIYQKFRSQFLAFSIFQSCVQFLQYYYQRGCLYRLRALGERNHLDLTVEGFQSWMWRGLTFLLPFLFCGHFWQLYNAVTLFELSSHEECREWQVFVLALTFLVLFLGNFLTTLKVVHAKLQQNRGKAKKP